MPQSKFAAPSYPIIKKLNNLWFRLTGSPSVFSLESRIFHSISIGLIILGVVYVPYNFFAGLYVASLSSFVIASFFSYQFYNSRFHGKPHSNVLFALTGILIFSVNYFANSGINGSTDLIWPAYLLLVFAISPYRQHMLWLIVYILCFLILHILEYYHPFWVKHPFDAGRGQFIDRVTAFPIPVIAVYIIVKFIRKSYDKERIATEEKALAIEVRNEQILLQKNQLEQSDAEKNKLMSIISHDLRAPLIHIQNYLELLNENELDSQLRPVLEKDLLMATNNTMEMLSNLLHWSRSQMEGPTVNLLTINLLSAIKSTLDMGKMQAAKKDISLNYNIEPQIAVVADIDMLQLVIRNLVSNAIKFTPNGGIININALEIQHECKITVSDNGKGIDQCKQDKIFSINTEPAFGTNNEKGVGLGLLLCKEFIERQGGRIGFESIFGQGSSFYIFLPSFPSHKD
ncbi:HAMP domain-containing histidine kinase [Mucilaginibacter sp. BJC16-A38]|uniref:sensor histidine kinase n=1 Tax=Mucilaginibacter phenanthrenivorans TaxID=1234842 RepID=UPI002158623F|nr:HAMP domain-containing sensor histidine kinase [Mucilaginibacter phenanthrenivorans]MCR8557245.1 HAMP domain-containing histidine kinase [Mucilaginibacter phenanthrenivorans]